EWKENIPRGRAYQIQVLTAGELKVEPTSVELAARNPAQ
ncbi:MAG: Cro/CI family transcriptional regulator, partial [Aeromonas sp.]